jgi:hypothetical protein
MLPEGGNAAHRSGPKMWFGMGQVLESPYLSVAWVRILHARHRVDGSIERCTDDLGVQFSLFEIHNS